MVRAIRRLKGADVRPPESKGREADDEDRTSVPDGSRSRSSADIPTSTVRLASNNQGCLIFTIKRGVGIAFDIKPVYNV